MQSGNANVLLLLTGQTTYLQAVTQVVQARSARLADTAALFAALGGGWWNRTAPLPEKTLDVGSGEARPVVERHDGLFEIFFPYQPNRPPSRRGTSSGKHPNIRTITSPRARA